LELRARRNNLSNGPPGLTASGAREKSAHFKANRRAGRKPFPSATAGSADRSSKKRLAKRGRERLGRNPRKMKRVDSVQEAEAGRHLRV